MCVCVSECVCVCVCVCVCTFTGELRACVLEPGHYRIAWGLYGSGRIRDSLATTVFFFYGKQLSTD